MCGFLVQFLSPVGCFKQSQLIDRLRRLKHRGPDQQNTWSNRYIWMGHQRLVLLGGEKTGQQPLVNSSGNALVYNGEIYNCQELQSKYLSTSLINDSDILFALLNTCGTSIIAQLRGMFSFVYYKCKENQVWLVRDPFGMKPLYYKQIEEGWEFSSEIRAFDDLETDPLQAEIFHHHMAPLPGYSLYKKIYEVRPGSIKTIDSDSEKSEHYVNLGSVFNRAQNTKFGSSSVPLNDTEFSALFDQTVQLHLLADTPPGLVLSGGLDSGCIALSLSDTLNKAYTMSISGMDESSCAASLADSIGVSHRVFQNSSLKHIEDVLNAMDGPIGDASFFPTWDLFYQLKNFEKSVLGGDGGDELFYGYPTFEVEALRQKTPNFLIGFGRRIGLAVGSYSNSRVDIWEKLLRFGWGESDFTMFRQMQYMAAKPMDQLSLEALELIHQNFQQTIELEKIDSSCEWSQIFTYYFRYYLATQVLTKSDRASMSHSVELRSPYLDWSFFSSSFQFPDNGFPITSSRKQVLRNYYRSYKKLENLSKRGFSAPLQKILPRLEKYVANQRGRRERSNTALLEDSNVGLHARYLELIYEYFHGSFIVNSEVHSTECRSTL